MTIDYAEQLLKAMEIISERNISNLAFDRSEVCTIIDNSDKKNGKYLVSNGSAKFDAYVNMQGSGKVPEYKVDDSVRVSIPNGDYTQKKYIEGLSVTDNSLTPITYISPLDAMLDISNNIIPDTSDRSIGLRANDKSVNQICVWSADLSQPDFAELQNSNIYDTIAIKADFKTLLNTYNVIEGSYGLRLDMYVQPADNANSRIKYTAYLDSSNMFGNPYSFMIYSTQATKFSVAEIGQISTVSLYFYQNCDFVYLDENGYRWRVPDVAELEDAEKKQIYPNDYSNLLVQNVSLSFGSDIVNIPDNTLKLYTNDSMVFDRLAVDESFNTKELGILWYNKTEDGQYIGFSDGLVHFVGEEEVPYDEIEYLKSIATDNKLMAQQGKNVPEDETGLTLSANIEEAEKILKTLKTSLTKDLYQNLISFRNRIDALLGEVIDEDETTLREAFDKVVNKSDGDITNTGIELENKTSAFVKYYADMLANAKIKVQDGGTNYVIPGNDEIVVPDDVIAAARSLLSSDGSVQKLLAQTADLIKEKYTGFQSIYDSFYTRTMKLIDNSNSHIDSFLEKVNGDENKLREFFRKDYQFTKYASVDDGSNDYKYCIYWYRYEPGFYDAEERFMERGWRRLTFEELGKANFGLPENQIEKDGIKYFDKKPFGNEGILSRVLDGEFVEERYTVVLFYNHNMYKSNELVFKNINPPADSSITDMVDALRIDHGTNSRTDYQLHGSNYYLVNLADGYRKRELKVSYEGNLGGDEQLIDGQVFWYVPKDATMLICNENDFSSDFSIYDGEDDLKGYKCFYRSVAVDNDGILDENSLLFPYHIKEYYLPSASRNEIICRVITKDQRILEASMSFTFSTFGTSGTDYSLIITPANFKSAINEDQNDNGTNLYLDVSLFDYDNNEIDLIEGDTDVSWVGPHSYKAILDAKDGLIKGCFISFEDGITDDNLCYYNVIKVDTVFTIEKEDEDGKPTFRTVNLSAYYPIAYSDACYYMEGASTVIYDSAGANPSYYKNPYRVFSYSGQEPITKWELIFYDKNGKKVVPDGILSSYMPIIENDKLIPSPMYLDTSVDEENVFPVAIGYQDSVMLWAQPIYIAQNQYSSPMLNAWDGSLQIDEENGTILSAMVGAGKKNTDNTFSGVLMGDVGGTVNTDNATGIGLYGYHEGAQSFHFGVDGTAFIGKSKRGRIKFNGNSGTISSASWEQDHGAGVLIDLDDGLIDIKGAKQDANGKYSADGKQAHIVLNAKGETTNPYFRITSPKNGLDLIHIGPENYFLQTDDYITGDFNIEDGKTNTDADGNRIAGKGTKIDLAGSLIDSYNLKIRSKNIFLDSTENASPYLIVKANSGNNLLYVSDDKYYLKTNNYSAENKTGTKIDLDSGRIDSYDFTLSTSNIYLSDTPNNNFSIGGEERDNIVLRLGNNFGVDNTGKLYASAGTIGGWTINKDSLSGSGKISGGDISGSTITGGSINIGSGTFKVSSTGALTATSATITGSITATSGSFTGSIYSSKGTIAGWTINSNYLSSSGGYHIYSTGTAQFGKTTVSSLYIGASNIVDYIINQVGTHNHTITHRETTIGDQTVVYYVANQTGYSSI